MKTREQLIEMAILCAQAYFGNDDQPEIEPMQACALDFLLWALGLKNSVPDKILEKAKDSQAMKQEIATIAKKWEASGYSVEELGKLCRESCKSVEVAVVKMDIHDLPNNWNEKPE